MPHRSASECGPQTGDRGSVSNSRLSFEIADPQAAHGFADQIIEFVSVGATANPSDPFASVERATVYVSFDESLIPRFLYPVRNLINRLFPRNIFPVIRAGAANLRLQEPTRVQDVLLE